MPHGRHPYPHPYRRHHPIAPDPRLGEASPASPQLANRCATLLSRSMGPPTLFFRRVTFGLSRDDDGQAPRTHLITFLRLALAVSSLLLRYSDGLTAGLAASRRQTDRYGHAGRVSYQHAYFVELAESPFLRQMSRRAIERSCQTGSDPIMSRWTLAERLAASGVISPWPGPRRGPQLALAHALRATSPQRFRRSCSHGLDPGKAG